MKEKEEKKMATIEIRSIHLNEEESMNLIKKLKNPPSEAETNGFRRLREECLRKRAERNKKWEI